MNIRKEDYVKSEDTLGCERLKTDNHSQGKVFYIHIVIISNYINPLIIKIELKARLKLYFISDDYSKYDNFSPIAVRKEIFESVQKELRDEINIAIEDQVMILVI